MNNSTSDFEELHNIIIHFYRWLQFTLKNTETNTFSKYIHRWQQCRNTLELDKDFVMRAKFKNLKDEMPRFNYLFKF